ncbi:hypothetical protein L1280_001452 [Deinococcus sp. HSC-46F16]|uniref:hypothetical protein n=1 Tax=Deinococcus sp. HSC-46F16 TaxID=2910968 RepID=UPI00209D58E8|nr:hypothetical protein [Deinococcus sp. HSC-46F16]MCP2014315.1 hypothetical protein [Deinococcus sp. HSC-46F16]
MVTLPRPFRDRARARLTLALAAAQVGAIVWQAVLSREGADLSQRGDDPPVVPALYTFAIWAPIYASSFAYAAYQARTGQAARPLHRQAGPWAAAAFGAAALWAVAAGLPAPGVTWGTAGLMFVMCGSLCLALDRASALAGDRADRLLVVTPLGLYAGYVTLATVANAASSLQASGVTAPLGIGPTSWAMGMLAVAGGAASLMVRRTGAPLAYSAAVVWGLTGVVVQNVAVRPNPPVAWAAGLAALGVLGATWWGRAGQAAGRAKARPA